MAEDQDQDQKTEEPTQHKLDEARKRGQVVTSKELINAMMLLASFFALSVVLPLTTSSMFRSMQHYLEQAGRVTLDSQNLANAMSPMLAAFLVAILPTMGLLLVVALAAHIVQHGFVWSAESLKPKLSKLSPLTGFKRIFGMKSVVEFVKNLIKITLVGTLAFMVVWPRIQHLENLITMEIAESTQLLLQMAGRLMFALGLATALLAIADYLYQRYSFMKGQRMTLQEVKDEMRNAEGDPMVKARLKQIRRERAKKRMMAAVPKSTVVITNPTHYAVALKFEIDKMNAPILVAKGMDEVAKRIRQLAFENQVPILENPPLARALHKDVELDAEIPTEHYQAVAEIIGYILRLKGKVRGAGAPTPPPAGSRLRRDPF